MSKDSKKKGRFKYFNYRWVYFSLAIAFFISIFDLIGGSEVQGVKGKGSVLFAVPVALNEVFGAGLTVFILVILIVILIPVTISKMLEYQSYIGTSTNEYAISRDLDDIYINQYIREHSRVEEGVMLELIAAHNSDHKEAGLWLMEKLLMIRKKIKKNKYFVICFDGEEYVLTTEKDFKMVLCIYFPDVIL
ncbi:MAG TPA: hypothetical protein ENJ08_09340 [Gammaproteobacteria bacterium]|nr:hypothetical protein [Gammaproteobacteria bacterium]